MAILPEEFPQPMVSVQCDIKSGDTKDSLDQIKEDFKYVLSNTSTKTPMSGPPMVIHLKKRFIPKKVLTARQTPLHLCPGAEKGVQSLIEEDVIENSSEPTDWIAAGMFAKKAKPYVKMETDKPPGEEKTPGNGKNLKTIPDPRLHLYQNQKGSSLYHIQQKQTPSLNWEERKLGRMNHVAQRRCLLLLNMVQGAAFLVLMEV